MTTDLRREERLRALGWEFVQTGPSEWSWLKFDAAGELIARWGDDTWEGDNLPLKMEHGR